MKNLLLCIMLALILIGCTPISAISIRVSYWQNPLISLSSANMGIKKFVIRGNGPKKQKYIGRIDSRINKFKHTTTGDCIELDNVIPGTWNITVSAYNIDGALIAFGEKTVKAFDKAFVNVIIPIKPFKFNTIVNHNMATPEILLDIPSYDTNMVHQKTIIYCHSEYGSQISKGLEKLDEYVINGNFDIYSTVTLAKFKDITTGIGVANRAIDLGNPDKVTWKVATQEYLNKPENSDVNILIWSWGENQTTVNLNGLDSDIYINGMEELIEMYPKVQFVFMTSPNDGKGITGNTYKLNERIRTHCADKLRWLLDVADIEKYDINGSFYGDVILPNGIYDSNGNGIIEPTIDGNWQYVFETTNLVNQYVLTYWQGARWYNCGITDHYSISANMKAYAMWYMLSLITEYSFFDVE